MRLRKTESIVAVIAPEIAEIKQAEVNHNENKISSILGKTTRISHSTSTFEMWAVHKNE
jgi:hypothetical protein